MTIETHSPNSDAGEVQRAMRRRALRPRVFDAVGLFVRGIAMGAADIVPGISGGTIALITGIYERFIDALGSLSPAFLAPLSRGDVREAARRFLAMRWEVLIPLASGIVLAVLLMSRVIPQLMEERPGATFAFFFGLIAASVWIPFAMMKRRTAAHYAVTAAAALGAWLFVGLQPEGVELRASRHDVGATTVVYAGKVRTDGDLATLTAAAEVIGGATVERIIFIDGRHGAVDDVIQAGGIELRPVADRAQLDEWLTDGEPLLVLAETRASLIWIFVCGAVAISAMILPGISGAFLLLFLGQYHAVLTAVHGVIDPALAMVGLSDAGAAIDGRGWFENVFFLGAFMLGIVFGVIGFSRVVRWLLRRAHDGTMAALTGLMIGGLRQPAQQVKLASVDAPSNYWLVVVGSIAAGAAVVTLLNFVDKRLTARRLPAS